MSIPVGTVVNLRAGGPSMTVIGTFGESRVDVAYYNPISGLVVNYQLPTAAFRQAATTPETPANAQLMRQTPRASLGDV